ncbi:hypothetical protein [Paenibacillus odorifer]|uniref:hypothetical protein n=2 Tax=Paenibacillus TaxID=44249 RepID=UPI0020BF0B95|nr:hypothetical protein [Paenibacillus odorifer]
MAVVIFPTVPLSKASGKKEITNCMIPNNPIEYAKHKYRTRSSDNTRLTTQMQATAVPDNDIPSRTAAIETTKPMTRPLHTVRHVS